MKKFTIVELLVVIAIVVILGGMAYSAIINPEGTFNQPSENTYSDGK